MKHLKLTVIFLLTTLSIMAQNKLQKLNKNIPVNNNVTIDLNTSHTNIEVDTWSKDYVEIEATIKGKTITNKALQDALNDWQLDIESSKNNIKITSTGSLGLWTDDSDNTILDCESIEALSNVNFPLDLDLNLEPLLNGLSNLESLKELPETIKIFRFPESPDGNYNIDFDVDRYEKEGEKYLNQWSKKYHKEYGAAYEQEMREWAKSIKKSDIKKFEKEMEAWGEKFGEEFEKNFEENFGKEFEKRMEKWGEEFGESLEKNLVPAIEKWAEELGKAFEEKTEEKDNHSKSKGLFNNNSNRYDVIKTIKIKMPKKAKLKLNVRHGELKIASTISNPNMTIAHGSLLANTIDGSDTFVDVLYSNASILNWYDGVLNLNYADKSSIKTAENLVLNAVSSNIDIDVLSGNSIIDGSFGDLFVNTISEKFNNLNIILENSDAYLKLPNTNYNLFFKGNHSTLNKENTTNKTIKNASSTTNKTIVINAKYSSVITK